MSRYNPRIYNFANLKVIDKVAISSILLCVDELENAKEEYARLGNDSSRTMNIIEYECKQEAAEECAENLRIVAINTIISLIDGYEEDVEEIDTDDFFYGYEDKYKIPEFISSFEE